MNIAITGASGFIGRRLLREFRRRQWNVRALQHRISVDSNDPSEVVEGDITDPGALKALTEGTDILFHLAAALGARLISEKDFFRVNAAGTKNVLDAAKANGVRRIIHFSSAGVIGSVKMGEVADENYPKAPKNIYDSTKLEAEKLALEYAAAGLDVVILRPGWVYGPGDRRTFKLIHAIAKNRFVLVTKGDAWQTPVHIDDLIRGVLLCAEKGEAKEIYHIAGDEVLSVKRIVAAIASATENRLPAFTLPLWPVKAAAGIMEKTFALFGKEAPLTTGRLAFFIHPKPLSIAKAKKELGFLPQIDFKSGIAQTVSWCKSNGWLR
ncbi:MAG: NAD-dependent epimerase/dehydratase family protein [Candidatus Aminicenantes bacterium]|nr:NAD-dependent epimerase/dehydratase family protein [Candidatus Aminicenantes bacterium]